MTAQEVFDRIRKATHDYPGPPMPEEFIRGLASRSLNLPAKDPFPEDEFEDWWVPANDGQIVEWWRFATWQHTDVHPEVTEPTDAQIIGGQLFADRMGGD